LVVPLTFFATTLNLSLPATRRLTRIVTEVFVILSLVILSLRGSAS